MAKLILKELISGAQYPLSDAVTRVKAVEHGQYQLIDAKTGEVDQNVVVAVHGNDLIIHERGENQVAVVEGFGAAPKTEGMPSGYVAEYRDASGEEMVAPITAEQLANLNLPGAEQGDEKTAGLFDSIALGPVVGALLGAGLIGLAGWGVWRLWDNYTYKKDAEDNAHDAFIRADQSSFELTQSGKGFKIKGTSKWLDGKTADLVDAEGHKIASADIDDDKWEIEVKSGDLKKMGLSEDIPKTFYVQAKNYGDDTNTSQGLSVKQNFYADPKINNIVADNDAHVTAETYQSGLTLKGRASGENIDGAKVVVTINGRQFETHLDANGDWDLHLSKADVESLHLSAGKVNATVECMGASRTVEIPVDSIPGVTDGKTATGSDATVVDATGEFDAVPNVDLTDPNAPPGPQHPAGPFDSTPNADLTAGGDSDPAGHGAGAPNPAGGAQQAHPVDPAHFDHTYVLPSFAMSALKGSAGKDLFKVEKFDNGTIDAGEGYDALSLTGHGVVDLGSLKGFEQIDLGKDKGNKLVIDAKDLENNGDGAHVLRIDGVEGQKVEVHGAHAKGEAVKNDSTGDYELQYDVNGQTYTLSIDEQLYSGGAGVL